MIRVVFDTNVFISYLIGRRLRSLSKKLSNETIKIVFSDQLVNELILVTSRPKFKQYFSKKDVKDLIDLIEEIGVKYSDFEIPVVCRDSKDNFLLGLIKASKADFLVTGDEDLQILGTFYVTDIVSAAKFEEIINQ